jgi:hypothetical protein
MSVFGWHRLRRLALRVRASSAVDSNGVVHQLAEYFSQRQDRQKGMLLPSSLEHRAKAIDAIMSPSMDVPRTPRSGATSPTRRTSSRSTSPPRSVEVRRRRRRRQPQGAATSVERLNDILDTNTLRYRRDVVEATAKILEQKFPTVRSAALPGMARGLHLDQPWRRGPQPPRVSAGKTKEWAYTPTEEGEEQDQDACGRIRGWRRPHRGQALWRS